MEAHCGAIAGRVIILILVTLIVSIILLKDSRSQSHMIAEVGTVSGHCN